jgi:hypothetical protein
VSLVQGCVWLGVEEQILTIGLDGISILEDPSIAVVTHDAYVFELDPFAYVDDSTRANTVALDEHSYTEVS